MSQVVPDVVRPRVTSGHAVVSAIANPLVALYSAPACHHGSVRVRFRPLDEPDAPWKSTNALRCVPGRSRNFLVAGMRASTAYAIVHETSGAADAVPLVFTTGAPPASLDIPSFTVPEAPAPDADLRDDVIYHNLAGCPAPNAVNLLATDLQGRLLWYYDPLASGLVAIGLPGSTLLPGGTVLLGGRDPRDRNLLVSVRHQDWIVKIDYRDGDGDGHVIWRLGAGGDFALDSSEPDAWFSHQHYPHYLADGRTLLLFDNGNTRQATDPAAHSRGQAWRLDEEDMIATPVLNVDVGNYSDSLGTADRRADGHLVFDSGSQGAPPAQFGQSIEMRTDGTTAYVQQVDGREPCAPARLLIGEESD